MTYLIEATAVLAAVYFATAFVHGLVRYQPQQAFARDENYEISGVSVEKQQAFARQDATPQETLSAMTLTHLRQLATALNRAHPGTIRKVETRRKNSAISALSKHWQTLIDAGLIEQQLTPA